MTAWVTFEAAVEPLVWGRATYTILRLPPDAAQALIDAGAKRVEGEIAEHPVNLALSRAPEVEGVFLWAGQSLLDRLGIAPGESVEVRLRPAPPDEVDTPEDVALALRQADLTGVWEALTPGNQIGTAKTPATRTKRLAALIESLSA
jgi:hypothetical protein